MMYHIVHWSIGLIKHNNTLKILTAELREKCKKNSLDIKQWYRQILEMFSYKKMEINQTKKKKKTSRINKSFSNVPNKFLIIKYFNFWKKWFVMKR